MSSRVGRRTHPGQLPCFAQAEHKQGWASENDSQPEHAEQQGKHRETCEHKSRGSGDSSCFERAALNARPDGLKKIRGGHGRLEAELFAKHADEVRNPGTMGNGGLHLLLTWKLLVSFREPITDGIEAMRSSRLRLRESGENTSKEGGSCNGGPRIFPDVTCGDSERVVRSFLGSLQGLAAFFGEFVNRGDGFLIFFVHGKDKSSALGMPALRKESGISRSGMSAENHDRHRQRERSLRPPPLFDDYCP